MADGVVLPGNPDESLEEREALQRVLRSQLFQRAPNLSRILEYICEEYFDGNADKIKEYNIAVGALGRSADFDPQVDAIVRVDLHLLRKRLRAYYSDEAKHDELQIVLHSGSYVPEFVPGREKSRSHAALTGVQPRPSQEESALPFSGLMQNPINQGTVRSAQVPSDSALRRTGRGGWHLWLGGAICGLLVLLTGLVALTLATVRHAPSLVVVNRLPAPLKTVTATVLQNLNLGSQPDALLDGIRIRCGSGSDYVDSAGLHWLGDRNFTGGSVFERPVNSIVRSTDPALYGSGRQGVFQYAIPVSPGAYEVHLLFAETQPGIEDGMRLVSYTVGLGQADSIDIVSDAEGQNAATERVYSDVHPGEDGSIQLNFWATNSSLNAIEIVPEANAKPQPVRISTLQTLYRDISGGHWLPDRFFRGGRNVQHEFARNRPDPPLFTRERYGNFDYSIPVAKGYKYQITLLTSEHFWGPQYSGSGGVGSRIFNVRCNGMNLLTNFDVLAAEKGSRAIAVRFRDLEPDDTGELRLSFVPVINFPVINAIEVDAQ